MQKIVNYINGEWVKPVVNEYFKEGRGRTLAKRLVPTVLNYLPRSDYES